MMLLAPFLTVSLGVAIAGPVLSAFADSPMATHLSMFAPASLWSMLLVATLVVHGKLRPLAPRRCTFRFVYSTDVGTSLFCLWMFDFSRRLTSKLHSGCEQILGGE